MVSLVSINSHLRTLSGVLLGTAIILFIFLITPSPQNGPLPAYWSPNHNAACPACHCVFDEPASLLNSPLESSQSSAQSSSSSSCSWSEIQATIPRENHWMTVLMLENSSDNSLQFSSVASRFTDPALKHRVRVVVGKVTGESLCIGDSDSSSTNCAKRSVIQTNTDVDGNGQSLSDWMTLIDLYWDSCRDLDRPLLLTLFESTTTICPGFEYHLAGLMQYMMKGLAGRTGAPFAVRVGPGTSGVIVPSHSFSSLKAKLHRDLDSTNFAPLGHLIDDWALGSSTATGFKASIGRFMYHLNLLVSLPDSRDTDSQATVCSSALTWDYGRPRSPDCFGQALDPCTPDLFGEYWSGDPTLFDPHELPPAWFVSNVQAAYVSNPAPQTRFWIIARSTLLLAFAAGVWTYRKTLKDVFGPATHGLDRHSD